MENETETDNENDAAAVETVGEGVNDAARVETIETEKRELHERLLRTAADFDNFRKRSEKDLKNAEHRGREGILKELLPVMDNLERALKHAAANDPVAQGVRLVEKQMLNALEKFGITRFESLGQQFDPALHDAIQQVESASATPGTVAEEFARGYMHNGKLLRPAMVAVAKSKAVDDGGEPTN